MTDDVKDTPDVATLQAQLNEALEGIEKLKGKNDELIGEKRRTQAAADAAAEAARVALEEAARKSGDTAALDASWNEKYTRDLAARDELIRDRDNRLVDLTVNATAQRLAAELAVPGKADVLMPFIKQRLAYQDGKTVVVDAEGKPSASTVDELAKEVAADKRFDVLIVASLATGGGAPGGKGGAPDKNPKADIGGDKTARLARVDELLKQHSQ